MRKGLKVETNHILDLIKSGLIPSQISKKYSIPKGTLAYHVDKLKKKGCIVPKGYGVWEYIKPFKEVRKVPKGHIKGQKSNFSTVKEIRGHAFIWKIEFVEPYQWEKVLKYYRKKKLSFQMICNNKVPRTIFNNRKIWLTKKGFTIYEPLDFYGKSSFEVKSTAIFEMDNLIKGLLNELNQKFRPYRFTTSREHYGMIKNELARQFNRNKQKMEIRSEDGDIWLWIDDSKSLGELETQEPNISRQVQNYWNNQRKHKFKVDADFILEGFSKTNELIKKNAESNKIYGDNSVAHVKLMKNIDKNLQKQTDIFERITTALESKL